MSEQPQFVSEIPPRRGHYGKHDVSVQFAQALRSNPGQWAVWPGSLSPKSVYAIASRINRGQNKAFPVGEYEAAGREGVVYVRYIGSSHTASNPGTKPEPTQVTESAKASTESDPPKQRPAQKAAAPKLITAEQSARIGELMAALGVIDEADQRDLAARILGKPVPVPGKLTIDEADTLIAELADALAAERAKAEGRAQ
ncbi:hypothetical protein [Nocardia sp. NPDC059239]|uniref:hypothetical protein n=1 Tax=unclassified Nocardia TaxID=2637762 RepID=UPI00368697B9